MHSLPLTLQSAFSGVILFNIFFSFWKSYCSVAKVNMHSMGILNCFLMFMPPKYQHSLFICGQNESLNCLNRSLQVWRMLQIQFNLCNQMLDKTNTHTHKHKLPTAYWFSVFVRKTRLSWAELLLFIPLISRLNRNSIATSAFLTLNIESTDLRVLRSYLKFIWIWSVHDIDKQIE